MTTPALPHWDMTSIYPGLDSPEFAAGFESTLQAVGDLVALFDEHGIERPAAPLAVDEALIARFETVLTAYNQTLERLNTLRAYITSFVATDSRNLQAQARMSELQQRSLPVQLLTKRLIAWMGALDTEALIAASPLAQAHAFTLRTARVWAAHQLSPAEETLISELQLTGSSAWAKLYSTYTSQIAVDVPLPSGTVTLPMSAVRNLAFDPDRAVRRSAYTAELQAWERHALPIASAMNSIKGETLRLSLRRGWASPLDQVLFENAMDRTTLEAMQTAVQEALPDFRRYLRAKARALGLERLAWYDLFAPVSEAGRQWSFDEARAFIVDVFGRYSPRLQALAERAFREHWIDAEPRPGKRDGAFCMWVRDAESRVLSNFKPAFAGMSTLAHELGHAYHNAVRAGCTYLQRQTPRALAETASIFCETLAQHVALEQASPEEQFIILEAALQDSCQVVVDIASRFIFEQAVFERRAARELSAPEFCTLMREAQLATYGDALDPEALHPYMWAVKPHYYGDTFYNFPYTFGLLFGLGLYARYQEAPDTFRAHYDDLLASTGLDDAAHLAARFGMDIRTPDFWRASLDIIRADIAQFEHLVASR